MTKTLLRTLCLIAMAASLQACVEKAVPGAAIRSYDIIGKDRSVIGTLRLAEAPNGGVTVVVDANSIQEGEHGIHLHVTADCSAPDFKSAGGHINPDGKPHGLKHPEGPDNADMHNAVADKLGIVSFATVNKRVSMSGAHGLPALLDADGSALVIHQFPDDQISQPIGGAGPRIACAEIGKPASK
ncbi:MAG: superoxide dismutase family protein [Alphaproteobacteria bacterium]